MYTEEKHSSRIDGYFFGGGGKNCNVLETIPRKRLLYKWNDGEYNTYNIIIKTYTYIYVYKYYTITETHKYISVY